MSSPSIRISPSFLGISKTHHSSQSNIPPFNHSPCSADSKISCKWTKEVENCRTSKNTSSPKHLTQEDPEELNRRNEIIHVSKKTSPAMYSPYYKGLIDYSLVIGREKHLSPATPGRESSGSSISSGSKSSNFFVNKVQELASWFTIRVEDKSMEMLKSMSSSTRSSQHTHASSSSASSMTKAPTKTIGSSDEGVGLTVRNMDSLSTTQKPLRESDLQPPVPPLSLLVLVSAPPPADPSQPLESLPLRVESTSSTPPSKPLASPHPRVESSPPLVSSPQLLPPPSPTLAQISPELSPPPPSPPPPQSHRLLPSPPESPAQTTLQRWVQQEAQTSPQWLLPSPAQTPPQSPAETLPAKRVILDEMEAVNTKNERVFTWADKYRPQTLKDFICNRSKALEIQALVKAKDCQHCIIEGPPGVGKRTMIRALLREAFGAERVQAREECKQFILKGEAVGSIKATVKTSMQHVEINLSEVKGYEKHVIAELIQQPTTQQDNDNICRVIILNEADKLSTDASLYIKWLLERYSGTSKLLFSGTDVSKLEPIKSICKVVPLLPPSNEEIVEVLKFIAKQEGIELPQKLAKTIAENSKNNLRQAIRSLEATWQSNSPLKEEQEVMTGWEEDIANIGKNIIEEQSPKQLYFIRGKLQNFIEHNVCPEFIFKELVKELKQHLAEQFHKQIDRMHEKNNNLAWNRKEDMVKPYDESAKKNLHHFLRIEEFIARFMSWYKINVVNKKEE